jgi:hypothetical protein
VRLPDLIVAVDSERDTVAVLKAYTSAISATVLALRGNPALRGKWNGRSPAGLRNNQPARKIVAELQTHMKYDIH